MLPGLSKQNYLDFKVIFDTLVWVDFSWCVGGQKTKVFFDFSGVLVSVLFTLFSDRGVNVSFPLFTEFLGVLIFDERPGRALSSLNNVFFSSRKLSTRVFKWMSILFNLLILLKQELCITPKEMFYSNTAVVVSTNKGILFFHTNFYH